jgi:hypothetical protein
MNAQFTEKEKAVINAIINSDYSSGDILDPVWMIEPSDCGFDNNKTLSGVISQLVQKGYVETGGTGKDAQIVLTEKYANL